MRGIIWYQGESNCLKGDTTIYTDRTEALVKGWRTVFEQDDLSFYFVQIAPFIYAEKFKKRNDKLTAESLPRFWDAQTACLKRLNNCGMVVVTDITGNVKDIHPQNKRDVGHRLARWALAKNYGQTDLVYSGPRYTGMAAEGGVATLKFNHTGGGLKSLDGEALSNFTIAGADKKFLPAKAEIAGATVKVSHPDVADPVAVRFAWHETAIGNLGNAEGLPAIPFRTDDW
jgi:sialate O-acetylesterase